MQSMGHALVLYIVDDHDHVLLLRQLHDDSMVERIFFIWLHFFSKPFHQYDIRCSNLAQSVYMLYANEFQD
jgi:hypothetical protein